MPYPKVPSRPSKSSAPASSSRLLPARAFGPSADLKTPLRRALSGGRALPEIVRTRLEGDLHGDFRDVRVHTGETPHFLNRSLQSRAFAVGQHIFFRKGAYQPASHRGQQLLAHELMHVRQQAEGRVRADATRARLPVSEGGSLEGEAERSGRAALLSPAPSSAAPQASPPGIVQRAGLRVGDIPNLTEDDRTNFLRVQEILGNRDVVHHHLRSLSQEVGSHELFQGDPRAALNAVLQQHEQGAGFSPHVPTVSGFVSPEEFAGMVRSKTMFDDLGASAQHGPATHRLQWHVIAKEMERRKQEGEEWHGVGTPADLYAKTAHPDYRIETPRADGSTAVHYPWDTLVDRVGRNPRSESTFVTFAEERAHPDIRQEEEVDYRGRSYHPLKPDAGVPIELSNRLRDPERHFGEEHGLDALSQAVQAGYDARNQAGPEAQVYAQAEQRLGQYSSALTRLPWVGPRLQGKVAYANEAQYLASPQAWKYQKVIPRGLRTGISSTLWNWTPGFVKRRWGGQ